MPVNTSVTSSVRCDWPAVSVGVGWFSFMVRTAQRRGQFSIFQGFPRECLHVTVLALRETSQLFDDIAVKGLGTYEANRALVREELFDCARLTDHLLNMQWPRRRAGLRLRPWPPPGDSVSL